MTTTAPTTATMDSDWAEAFTGRVVTDTAGLTTVVLASIGDQLGLWRALAEAGPATSAELAARTDTNERYVREWLAAMHAAGYVEYEPSSCRFTLPLELCREVGLGPVRQVVMDNPFNNLYEVRSS